LKASSSKGGSGEKWQGKKGIFKKDEQTGKKMGVEGRTQKPNRDKKQKKRRRKKKELEA